MVLSSIRQALSRLGSYSRSRGYSQSRGWFTGPSL